MKVTTKLLERLERIARKSHEEDVNAEYTISFMVCRACGYAEWMGSRDVGKGFKVEAVERGEFNDPCRRCHLAAIRAPEVFDWVMGMFNHQLYERDETETETDE